MPAHLPRESSPSFARRTQLRVSNLRTGDVMKYTKFLIAVSAIPLAMALGGCKHNSATTSGPSGCGSGPSLAEGGVSAVDKDGNPVDAAQAMNTKTDRKYQALEANAATST